MGFVSLSLSMHHTPETLDAVKALNPRKSHGELLAKGCVDARVPLLHKALDVQNVVPHKLQELIVGLWSVYD